MTDNKKDNIEEKLQKELIRLSKMQLNDRLKNLNARGDLRENSEITDYLMHELQVHQIELEMQNNQLREAQKELELSRDRYADLYDFSPVCYMTLSESCVVENINLTGCSMLGAERLNIIGRPLSLWLSNNDVHKLFTHIKKVLLSSGKVIDELTLKVNGGKFIDVRFESVRSLDEGRINYLCNSVVIDVTEIKRSQEAVHLQARQLKLITDSMPLQITYLDTEEKHIFVNKAYIDWFAISYSDVIGKDAKSIWSNKYYSRVKGYLDKAYMGQKVTFDMELSERESNSKYISVTMIPDFDMYNQVRGVILFIGDITEELAIEVIHRQKLLDAAEFSRLNTMGEMASEIAHELNQPLAAICIYSDTSKRLLKSNPSDLSLVLQNLTDISAQAERAGQIIKHIRSLVTKKELFLSNTDINELIKSSMELLEVELRTHNVKLVLDLESFMSAVYVDRILIEQVVINLCRNAIHAMTNIVENHRVLEIKSYVTSENTLQVCVKDTGPGLTREQRENIFQPFYTTKSEGMGLGLVICRSIIDAHQGLLWVDPTYDTGTMFCFTVPLTTGDSPNDR